MKRKLTAAQLALVATCKPLFTDDIWQQSVAYLYQLLGNADPPNSESWSQLQQLVRNFLDWCFTVTVDRPALHECLQHAAADEMSVELLHERNIQKCIFSGRRHPRVTARGETLGGRLQCTFRRWEHHADTGLICPHTSGPYVYESQFSFAVRGVYLLGHADELLKHSAYQLQEQLAGDEAQFVEHQTWQQWKDRIVSVMSVVYQSIVHTESM